MVTVFKYLKDCHINICLASYPEYTTKNNEKMVPKEKFTNCKIELPKQLKLLKNEVNHLM